MGMMGVESVLKYVIDSASKRVEQCVGREGPYLL